MVQGGEPLFSVENDLDWHGEGDSMVIDLGEGRHDETGDTLEDTSLQNDWKVQFDLNKAEHAVQSYAASKR